MTKSPLFPGRAVREDVNMKLPSPPSATVWRRIMVLGLVIILPGCASVDQAAFTQFAGSLQPLRAGTDSQAEAVVEGSRQTLIQGVADTADATVDAADLVLTFNESDPFAATYDAESEQLFFKLVRFRQGLSALNDALIGYSQSLVVLAGGAEDGDILPTSDEFDQMAQNLNTNVGTAAAALDATLDPGNQALLSTAAITLFKAYIENKRSGELRDAIREVQPQIDTFASAAQNAVRFLAERVETDYLIQIIPLATARPPDANPILALNETTLATLAMLGSLSSNYAALPAAHRELAAAASQRTTGIGGLVALRNEATRLQGFVAELAKANAAAAAEADAPPPPPSA